MASCCRAAPCEEMFGSESHARDDMESYLRRGLGGLETEMLAALPHSLTLDGARVLEIGGGVGAIQAELLKRGAATGEVVELVAGYAPFAELLAREIGLADRSTFRVNDLVADPAAVAPADIVVMNRVVCCSADGPELTAVAAGLARSVLLMSFPRSNLLTKTVAAAQRAVYRLLGRKYRAYAWPKERLVGAAERKGLAPFAVGGDWLWRYLVLTRTP